MARATLCDCMEEHDAAHAWNSVMFKDVTRLTDAMADLRPLLQPRQVPVSQPGAKPPEPDPVIRKEDVSDAVVVAGEVLRVVGQAAETLDSAAVDLVQSEVNRLKAARYTVDEGRRFARLRSATRGLTYLTGSILTGISAGIAANLLTSTDAARTLAQKLRPLFERLIQFFL